MNSRFYSIILLSWIFVDMLLKYHYETTFTHVIRIVIPLLLSAGAAYYVIHKPKNQNAELLWRIKILMIVFPILSLLVLFNWY